MGLGGERPTYGRFRRCGHGSGPMHPGDQKGVAEFTALLAARQRPSPWACRGDVSVRITRDGRGLERGRPADGQQPDADPVALVLIPPDTETVLTGTPPKTSSTSRRSSTTVHTRRSAGVHQLSVLRDLLTT